jgi:hypothetical protein
MARALRETSWLGRTKLASAVTVPAIKILVESIAAGALVVVPMVELAVGVITYAATALLAFGWHALRAPGILNAEDCSALEQKLLLEKDARAAERAHAMHLEAALAAARLPAKPAAPILEFEPSPGSAHEALFLRASVYNPPDGRPTSFRSDWTLEVTLPNGEMRVSDRGGFQPRTPFPSLDALEPGQTVNGTVSAAFRSGAPRALAGAHLRLSVTERNGRVIEAEADC